MRGRTLGISLTLVVILLAIAALGAFLYVRISSLARDLQSASDAAEDYVQALYDDPAAAPRHLSTATEALASAEHGLDTWALTTLGQVPQIGANVSAVRSVTTEMNRLLTDAGPVLSTAAEVVDFKTQQLRPLPESGSWFEGIDNAGDAVKKAADVIAGAPQAIRTFDEAQQKVHAIDTAGLLPQVRTSIDDLDDTLTKAATDLKPLIGVFAKLDETGLSSLLSGAAKGIGDAFGDIDLDGLFKDLKDRLGEIKTPITRGRVGG